MSELEDKLDLVLHKEDQLLQGQAELRVEHKVIHKDMLQGQEELRVDIANLTSLHLHPPHVMVSTSPPPAHTLSPLPPFTRAPPQVGSPFTPPSVHTAPPTRLPPFTPLASPPPSHQPPPSFSPMPSSSTPPPSLRVPPPPMVSPNVVRINHKLGHWGGTCTCPDGQVYEVGERGRDCQDLACVNGVPGTCHKRKSIHAPGAYVEAICGTSSDGGGPPPPSTPWSPEVERPDEDTEPGTIIPPEGGEVASEPLTPALPPPLPPRPP
eukprot:1332452-Prymnesium_polylepis.1